MKSTCIPDVGYFDSPEFLSLVLHINTIISTPIHLFGFYCIIWKTPIAMKSAKSYLLNLHIWVVLFDYSFSILTIPLMLLPHFVGYPLGILSWFDVSVLFQISMVFIFVGNLVVSIVAIFESRFYTVCEFTWKPYWKRWRRIGIICFHIIVSCLTLAFGFLAPDQEMAKRNMFAKLPCLPQYIYEANNFVLYVYEDYTYHLLCLVGVGLSALFMGILFAFFLMWNAVVQLKSRTMYVPQDFPAPAYLLVCTACYLFMDCTHALLLQSSVYQFCSVFIILTWVSVFDGYDISAPPLSRNIVPYFILEEEDSNTLRILQQKIGPL